MLRTKAIIDGWMIADGRGVTDGHQMRYVTPCVTQSIFHNSSLYIYSLPGTLTGGKTHSKHQAILSYV